MAKEHKDGPFFFSPRLLFVNQINVQAVLSIDFSVQTRVIQRSLLYFVCFSTVTLTPGLLRVVSANR